MKISIFALFLPLLLSASPIAFAASTSSDQDMRAIENALQVINVGVEAPPVMCKGDYDCPAAHYCDKVTGMCRHK